ncbi:MAG: CoA pyrophosphatase [Desulfohalobiaceae bacterium]
MNSKELDPLFRALPRHPGIMGKERFFNAAVLIPLLECDGELHFLFQKRARDIRQGGEICFPGGEHEPEADGLCRETALREAEEELGISRERVSILGHMDTLVSPRGITVDSFPALLDIRGPDELAPDPREVERVFSLPVSWFEENEPDTYWLKLQIQPSYVDGSGEKIDLLPVDTLGLPQRYASTWEGLRHSVAIYHSPQEVVWGLTAELIREFLTHLSRIRGNE